MLTFKKSSDPDFLKLKHSSLTVHKLDLLLKEQVEQRKDLSVINAMLKTLIADFGTQKQVDDYYDSPTSPQTESDDKNDLD